MPIGGFGGLGGGVINAPGSPYNGQSVMQVMQGLNVKAQSQDPAVQQQAIQGLTELSQLPQFKGFGWEGLAAFAGTVGLGSLVHAVQGAGLPGTTGTPGGGTGTPGGTTTPPTPTTPGSTSTGGVGGLLNSIFSKQNIPTLFSGGLALVNGVLQRQAANSAANQQTAAINNAAGLEAKTAANSLDFVKQVYGDQQTANKPFLEAGTNALGQVQQLIGPGGELSKDFTAPTAQEVRDTPGYQLKLDEAMKALARQTRGVTSGATLKAAERYASDYADTNYNEATNRALNIFNTNRSNRLNPLLTIAGYGPQAVSANNQSGNNAVSANTNISSNAVDTAASLGMANAANRGSASIAGTNALTAALQQIANLSQQRAALNRTSV